MAEISDKAMITPTTQVGVITTLHLRTWRSLVKTAGCRMVRLPRCTGLVLLTPAVTMSRVNLAECDTQCVAQRANEHQLRQVQFRVQVQAQVQVQAPGVREQSHRASRSVTFVQPRAANPGTLAV